MEITGIRRITDRLSAAPAGNYAARDAEQLADEVLAAGGWAESMPVPVLEIAESFGFQAYRESGMPGGAAGYIYTGGNTADMYAGHDKVILAETGMEWRQQRFILAHGLGRYLMDYLGSPLSGTPERLFSSAYRKERSGDIREERADRFAYGLLMPSRSFLRQFARAAWDSKCNDTYILTYLSGCFDVEESLAVKRIAQVMEG